MRCRRLLSALCARLPLRKRDQGRTRCAHFIRYIDYVPAKAAKLEARNPGAIKPTATESRATEPSLSPSPLGVTHIRLLKKQAAELKAEKSRATDPPPSDPPPQAQYTPLTLSDLLFPEEAKQRAEAIRLKARQERQIPRLSLEEAPSPLQKPRMGGNEKREAELHMQSLCMDYPQKSVVVLRSVSRALVEEDFRRVSPRGTHIEGWEQKLGSILKVIPARKPHTMEASGDYFLVFASPASARAYTDELLRLKRLVRSNTPRAMVPFIRPPPGYMVDGEDVHAAVQSFALVLPSLVVDLQEWTEPFTPYISKLLENGGYEALSAGEEETAGQVLLHAEGESLTLNMLQEAIYRDSRDRGVAWNLAERSPLRRLMVGEEEEGDDGSGGARAKKQSDLMARWIVQLKTNAEAKRFVREWHQRRLPIAPWYRSEKHVPRPLIKAELVW